jgi:cytochrome c oxidase subunit 4
MSSTTEHIEPAAHAEVVEHHAHDHHVPKDSYFVKVALILAFVTALETSTYWWGDWFNGNLDRAVVPALLIMMAIKFFMIASIFMHLKFDSRIFSMMFYTGLFLAIFVYIVFLATFQFFRS